MTSPRLDFDGPLVWDPQALTIAPSVHPAARETSALAAVSNQPARANQNTRVLALITAAGETGLSDIEIQSLTGFLRATICARRGDLRSLLTPAATRHTPRWTTTTYTRWRRKTESEMAS